MEFVFLEVDPFSVPYVLAALAAECNSPWPGRGGEAAPLTLAMLVNRFAVRAFSPGSQPRRSGMATLILSLDQALALFFR
jgi:hypothetical protein